MRNIKLTLEYDGTNFVGWQTQAAGRSVQEEIANVLHQILQHKVNLIGAGRTDSGVHARGQVANFKTVSMLDLDSLRNALNGMLADDVCIHAAEEVPEGFHSRYDAVSRVYRYFISLVPVALGRQYQWYVKYSLDMDLMTSAAGSVIGDHDFESFCKYASDTDHYRCSVTTSTWTTTQTGLVYEVRANRFLHGMVRALVGTMVDIARGHTKCTMFSEIMAAKDRTKAGMAAPAHGLCLEEVIY